MKITAYKTLDGGVFEHLQSAKNHTNRVYGDALNNITRDIINLKFVELVEYLDENAEALANLINLKNDLANISQEET